MLRILGKISIFGAKAPLERLLSVEPIPNSVFQQVGALRKVPDIDSWCYGSPWYRFRGDSLEDEIGNFLVAHERLQDLLVVRNIGITHALFTLCPVAQSHEETFSCLFNLETLDKLLLLGLALEIAPASVMPDVPYWLEVGVRSRGQV